MKGSIILMRALIQTGLRGFQTLLTFKHSHEEVVSFERSGSRQEIKDVIDSFAELSQILMDPETGCGLPSNGEKARFLIGTAH